MFAVMLLNSPSAWAWVSYVSKNRSLVVTRWIQSKRISRSEYTHPPSHLHSWEILKIRHQIQASPPVASRHIRNTCGAWQVKDSCLEFRGCWQEVLQKERSGVRKFWDHFFFPPTFEETSLPNSFPSPSRGLPSSPKVYARLTVRFHPRVLWRTASIFTQADRFAPSLSSNSWGLPVLPRIWFTKSSGPNEFSRAVGHHVRSFTASISQGSNVGFCHQLAPRAPLRAFTSSCSPSEATHLCYLSLLPSPCPLSSIFF